MIFGMSLYQILWYFLIYSFIGWVSEVTFHVVVLGKILNRGFLNGPVCPIYGFGVISVFVLAYFTVGGERMLAQVPLWQMFLGGALLATAVELAGGFLLDMCFHARWWDYSDKPFNLHGYICLEFALIWGFSITFVLRGIHPYIRAALVDFIPQHIGFPFLALMYILYVTDFVITVLMINRLNRRLRELDTLQKKLSVLSNGLTDAIGTGAYVAKNRLVREKQKAEDESRRLRARAAGAGKRIISGMGNIRKGLEDAAESGRELLNAKRRELMELIRKERYFGMGRLLHAYPGMKHRDYPELMKNLQEELNHEINREQE